MQKEKGVIEMSLGHSENAIKSFRRSLERVNGNVLDPDMTGHLIFEEKTKQCWIQFRQQDGRIKLLNMKSRIYCKSIDGRESFTEEELWQRALNSNQEELEKNERKSNLGDEIDPKYVTRLFDEPLLDSQDFYEIRLPDGRVGLIDKKKDQLCTSIDGKQFFTYGELWQRALNYNLEREDKTEKGICTEMNR